MQNEENVGVRPGTTFKAQIIIDRPPNFDKIHAVFPLASSEGVVFAYGDRIYNPSGQEMPQELIAHELAHCERQIAIGVDVWWDRYLTDKQFLFDEEVIAHKAEYRALKNQYGGQGQNKHILDHVATKLIAPLYGFTISRDHAKRILRGF